MIQLQNNAWKIYLDAWSFNPTFFVVSEESECVFPPSTTEHRREVATLNGIKTADVFIPAINLMSSS